MPPASQLKQKQDVIMERNKNKLKLAKYKSTKVALSEGQHDDWVQNVVNNIEEVKIV